MFGLLSVRQRSLVGSQEGQQGAGRLEGGGGAGRSWLEQGLGPTGGGGRGRLDGLVHPIVSSRAPQAAGLKTTIKSTGRRRDVSGLRAGPGQLGMVPGDGFRMLLLQGKTCSFKLCFQVFRCFCSLKGSCLFIRAYPSA